MKMKQPRFWKTLRANLLAPKVSQAELDRCLQQVREKLPVPVFWLLGKAQSGKTSLIRALTGSSRAEIGNGFRPCTRTAHLYPFPSDEDAFLKFLDTRGLGEVGYDPAEELRLLEDQSHLLIVVIKAMDHAQQSVLDPLAKIMKAHPNWPLLVVQTALHEGYSASGRDHVLPYPFVEPPYPASVPEDLARSLIAQRAWFAKYNARFVPVDLTLAEDGFNVEHYGLEQLWDAIEQTLPLGLRAMMQHTLDVRRSLRDTYFRAAHQHVLAYSVAAGAAAAFPVPFVDVPLVVAIQAKLYHAIASIYGQPMNAQRMAEIGSTLGIGYLVRLGGRELLKVIPGVGSAVSALYAGASTYALGRTLCVYFSYAQQGDVPDAAALRELYKEQYEEGRQKLRDYFEQITRGQETKP
jgi:uncharacterized protein (DUF697 family)